VETFDFAMKNARDHGHAGIAVVKIVETTDIPRTGQARHQGVAALKPGWKTTANTVTTRLVMPRKHP
jgi:hypothetical protein